MAAYNHPDFQDGGAKMLRELAATTGRIRYHILGSYTFGASFAAVQSATIGYAALVAGDITSGPGVDGARVQSLASKVLTLTGNDDGAGMHWAITDQTDSKVLVAGPGNPEDAPVQVGGQMISQAFAFFTQQQPPQS